MWGNWSCGMRSRYLELTTRVAEWRQASFEARVWLCAFDDGTEASWSAAVVEDSGWMDFPYLNTGCETWKICELAMISINLTRSHIKLWHMTLLQKHRVPEFRPSKYSNSKSNFSSSSCINCPWYSESPSHRSTCLQIESLSWLVPLPPLPPPPAWPVAKQDHVNDYQDSQFPYSAWPVAKQVHSVNNWHDSRSPYSASPVAKQHHSVND